MVSKDRGETMQEYLVMLLVISLVFLAFFQVAKKSVPLNNRIIYGTVGISFTLGAFFPMAISNLTTGKVLGIYFGSIALSAIILSHIESRFSSNVNSAAATESRAPGDSLLPTLVQNDFTEDNIRDEQPAAGGEMPEPSDVDTLEKSILGNTTDLPDIPPEPGQTDIPVDTAPDIGLPPAAPEDSPVLEDNIRDEELADGGEMPEPSDVDTPEQLIFDNTTDLPDMPPEPGQTDIPADTVPDIGLPPAAPEDTPVLRDVTGGETHKSEFAGQAAASRENFEDEESDAATATVNDDIIKDYVSAGFEAKARGDLNGAVNYFFKAFRLAQNQQVSTVLAMEISAIYQELGQYLQAGMIINSVLGQEDLIHDFGLKQKLKSQLVYLDTLVELLRIAKMPNAPYSKIPNFIKMKASIDTSAKLKNLI